jgi:hypothetical protein
MVLAFRVFIAREEGAMIARICLHYWVVVLLLGLAVGHVIVEPPQAPSLYAATSGVRLAVPFIHQYYADALAWDCGPSSLAMILEAYGKRPTAFTGEDAAFLIDIRRKAKRLGPDDPVYFRQLTDFDDLERVLADAVYAVPFTRLARDDSTLQKIKDAVGQRKPVIALLNSNHESMNRGYGGHWLVVIGFSADGQYVFVNDPDIRTTPNPNWNKATPGGQSRWPVALFEQALKNTGEVSSAIVVGDGLPTSAVLPPQIGSLGGTVRDSLGKPVAGATVVVSSDRMASATAKTNFSGDYSFTGLPSGDAVVTAIKGHAGAAVKLRVGEGAQDARLDLGIEESTLQQIVMPTDGMLRVNFVSTGSPGDQTACSGDFRQLSPTQRTIYPGYLYYAGLPTSLGLLPAQTAPVFTITPSGFCAGQTFSSTDSQRALILQPDPLTWILAWEDYTDTDFNDLVVRISLTPQAIPFLQLPFAPPGSDAANAAPSAQVEAFFDHEFPNGYDVPNAYSQYYVTPHGDDSQIDGTAAPIGASYDGNEGTDFRLKPQSDVRAAAAGTVVFAGRDTFSCAPLRNDKVAASVVKLRHTNGYVTEYWGLTSIAGTIDPQSGAIIDAGTVLGSSGGNPCAIGPARVGLHFVVRNAAGIAVDPFGWDPHATSSWYGLEDPWQQYQATQGQDGRSWWLWLTTEETSHLINANETATITSSGQRVTIDVPRGAFSGPVRLEVSETNAFVQTPFLTPLNGFRLAGFTTNEEAALSTQRPLQITIKASTSVTSVGIAAVSANAAPTLYRLDLTANGTVWTPIDTTWDSSTQQAQATIIELGTFVLALDRQTTFLPVVTR